MRITSVHCWKENLELKRPYSIAYHTVSAVENLFVLLTTDSGQYGIGAGAPAGFVTGENMAESLSQLSSFLPGFLVNKDIRNLPALLRQIHQYLSPFPAARAASDIALHDLWAQFLDKPLVDWFGRIHQSLPTSITIGIKDRVEETLEEAQEFMDLGFKIIKLKTGRSAEVDAETFSCLREKVGPNIKIRVDANQGYQAEDLIKFAQATASLEVEFYEQPLAPDNLAGMLELPPELAAKSAADENLHSPKDAINLASHPRHFGIYNIKLMKCGGVAEAMQIA